MTLKESLLKLARLWCAATDRTESRLAYIVVNDNKFFARLHAGSGLTVGTWEAFVGFFRTLENWPDERVPDDVAIILDSLPAHAPTERAEAA